MRLRKASCPMWFLAAFLVSIGGVTVGGQVVRPLSKRDYDIAVARFQTSTNRTPHQEITKTEEFDERKLVRTTETQREWDRNGNYRVITKKPDEAVTEDIWLGSIQYSRVGNGPWSKTDWSKGGTGSGDGPADASFYSMEEKAGPLRLLLFTEQRTFGEGATQRIKTRKTIVNALFWRQSVEQTESLGSPENVIRKSVTTFDYGREINELTAPIK